jgi:hypothetical protein
MQLGNYTLPSQYHQGAPHSGKESAFDARVDRYNTLRQPVEASRRYSFFILLELQPTPFIYPPTLFRFGIRVQWFAAKKGFPTN